MIAADGTAVTGGGNGVNSFTLGPYTIAGPNRIIICCVDNSNGSAAVSSITGAGLSFTLVGKKTKSSGTTEMWVAIAKQAFSAITFTVSMSGGAFPQVSGNLLGYSGASTNNLPEAIETSTTAGAGSGTSISQAITTKSDGALVIAAFGKNSNGAFTAGASQTLKGETSGGTVTRIAISEQNAVTSPPASVTMSVTWTGTTDNGAVIAVLGAFTNQGYLKQNRLRPHIFSPGLAR